MSHSYYVSFKKIATDEVFDFLSHFKESCTDHLADIAKENFNYCPFNRSSIMVTRDFVNISSEQKERAKEWAKAVFTYRFFYDKTFGLLCVLGVPDSVETMFDKTVHFQNSCDHDYDDWSGIPEFESMYNDYMTMDNKAVMAVYQKRFGISFFDDNQDKELITNEIKLSNQLDYWRRSFCYDAIWSHFSDRIEQDSNSIYFSVYGSNDEYSLYSFIVFCHRAQIAYEDGHPEFYKKKNTNNVSFVSMEELPDDSIF